MQVSSPGPHDTGRDADNQIEHLFIRDFGISSEQFVREMVAEFDQATPHEKAEFERLADKANAVLSVMHATLDCMGETLTEMNGTIGKIRQRIIEIDQGISGIEVHLGITPAVALSIGGEIR